MYRPFLFKNLRLATPIYFSKMANLFFESVLSSNRNRPNAYQAKLLPRNWRLIKCQNHWISSTISLSKFHWWKYQFENPSKQTTQTSTTNSPTLIGTISITQSMLFNKAGIDKNSAPNPLCPRCIRCDQGNLLNESRHLHLKSLLLLLVINWRTLQRLFWFITGRTWLPVNSFLSPTNFLHARLKLFDLKKY